MLTPHWHYLGQPQKNTSNGGDILVSTSNDNQEIGNGLLQAAQSYRENGWSVFPLLVCGKEPGLRSWGLYQKSAATEATINQWWDNGPDRNVGIVTGQISGLIVLDIDGPAGEESLAILGQVPRTTAVRTANGHHFYFKHPGGKLPIFADKRPGIDFWD